MGSHKCGDVRWWGGGRGVFLPGFKPGNARHSLTGGLIDAAADAAAPPPILRHQGQAGRDQPDDDGLQGGAREAGSAEQQVGGQLIGVPRLLGEAGGAERLGVGTSVTIGLRVGHGLQVSLESFGPLSPETSRLSRLI